MSSPSEHGTSGTGAERPVDQSDLPPWQRAERRRGAHAASTGPQSLPEPSPATRPSGAPTEIFPVVQASPPTLPPPPPPTGPPPAPHVGSGSAPGPPRLSNRPSAGLDARLSRFISGTAAPAGFVTGTGPRPPEATSEDLAPETARIEPPWSESNAQEPVRAPRNTDLPDLSGSPARPASGPRTQGAQGGSAVTVGPPRRGPLRASMQIRRIDPWATLKVSLVLSVVFFFVWMIAVALLYLVLGAMGVWSKLNENVGELITNNGGGELVSSGTIFGTALLIGLVNIVLMTAAATVGAFIYNLTTDLVGGIEVTLADRD